jgi:hypothetical protein
MWVESRSLTVESRSPTVELGASCDIACARILERS